MGTYISSPFDLTVLYFIFSFEKKLHVIKDSSAEVVLI